MADFFDFGLLRTFGVIYVKKSIIIARLQLVHVCLAHPALVRASACRTIAIQSAPSTGRYNLAIFSIYDFLAYKHHVNIA